MQLQRYLVPFLALVMIAGAAAKVRAADPNSAEWAGVLSLADEESVAKQLSLTEEQRSKLADLFFKREEAAGELALKQRDLAPEEYAAKLKEFREASEKAALELLTPEQRPMIEKIRLN